MVRQGEAGSECAHQIDLVGGQATSGHSSHPECHDVSLLGRTSWTNLPITWTAGCLLPKTPRLLDELPGVRSTPSALGRKLLCS